MAVLQSQVMPYSSIEVSPNRDLTEKIQSFSQVTEVEEAEVFLSAASTSSLLPPGTFDTHVHVFDRRLGPYAPTRAYTPDDAPLEDLLAFSKSISSVHRPTKFIVVQPSPYQTDNGVLLSTLQHLQDSGSFVRGIAVIDVDSVTDDELHLVNRLGVRGLRLNMQSDGHGVNVAALKSLMERTAARISCFLDWKLQLYAPACVWEELYDCILKLPVLLIADHTGGLLAPSKLEVEQHLFPMRQPGFESLVALAKSQKVIIKVSGFYRSSLEEATGFADMAPLVQELAARVPDSLIWASDWPHTGEGKDRLKAQPLTLTEPFRKINNIQILNNIRKWVGSEDNWMKMMVHNPRRVFA